MKTIKLKFHFQYELTHRKTAHNVLEIMTDYGLVIDKLDFYEPINIPFKKMYLTMWMNGLKDSYLFYASLKQRKSWMTFNPRGEGLPGSFYVAVNLSEAHFQERPDEWVLFLRRCATR